MTTLIVKQLLSFLFLLTSIQLTGQSQENFGDRNNQGGREFDPGTVLWFDQPATMWEEAWREMMP